MVVVRSPLELKMKVESLQIDMVDATQKYDLSLLPPVGAIEHQPE